MGLAAHTHGKLPLHDEMINDRFYEFTAQESGKSVLICEFSLEWRNSAEGQRFPARRARRCVREPDRGSPCPSDQPVPIVARPSPRDLRATSALAACCVPGSGATRGASPVRMRLRRLWTLTPPNEACPRPSRRPAAPAPASSRQAPTATMKRYPALPRSVPPSWSGHAPGGPNSSPPSRRSSPPTRSPGTSWTSHPWNSARPWLLRRTRPQVRPQATTPRNPRAPSPGPPTTTHRWGWEL